MIEFRKKGKTKKNQDYVKNFQNYYNVQMKVIF